MCNACGFLCCGSDEFSECGCDSCPYEACHYGPDDDEQSDWADDDVMDCVCASRPTSAKFECSAVRLEVSA